MMAAEQWCEYQKCYNKYGLTMKPELPKEKKPSRRRREVGVKPRDKAKLFFLVLFMGLLSVALILTSAYASQLKFETNSIIAQTEKTQSEIENLNLTIKKSVNISFIEEKAANELGMVYPEISQIAFIKERLDDNSEFAELLRQIAFKDER